MIILPGPSALWLHNVSTVVSAKYGYDFGFGLLDRFAIDEQECKKDRRPDE